VIKKLSGSSQKVRRAQMLLEADADGPAWTDAKIAEEDAAEAPGRQAGGAVDRIAAWSAAEGLFELEPASAGGPRGGVVDRGVDQPRNGASEAGKNALTQRKLEYGAIASAADAAFAAYREMVLDTSALPVDPKVWVLGMDEQPVQLLKETRTPIPATKHHPRRVDSEYERAGTASLFLFSEPLAGWRQVTVRERRTKLGWAWEVAALLRTKYREAEKVILVCDRARTRSARSPQRSGRTRPGNW
jgi:hypothetical protein